MVFADYEVPVAQSMIKMAIQLQDATAHPIEEFLCYWAAFNNIYVTIAERAGRTPQLRKNPDGSIRTRTVGGVDVPQVNVVGERDQIDLAFREFTDDLKRHLVEHPSSVFFVHRTPYWSGQPIERDGRGQRLNGVLNVGYTTDSKHPVWTPIDAKLFDAYHKGSSSNLKPLSNRFGSINWQTKVPSDDGYVFHHKIRFADGLSRL